MDNNSPIEDADVVEETPAEEPQETTLSSQPAAASDGSVMNQMNMEAMINRFIGDIEKLREQLKTQNDMFNDTFNNDALYAEQAEKTKAETRKKTEIKQRILKQPPVADQFSRIKALKDEIKESQETLSNLAQQYQKTTGNNQIMSDDGEVREIVVITKLIKKNSKYRP